MKILLKTIMPFAMILAVVALAQTPWAAADLRDLGQVPANDMEELIPQADLIVRGRVAQLRQELDRTFVKIQVAHVFKGDPTIKSLKLRHKGGKHIVAPEQPIFRSFDKAILYLKREGEYYRCVNGRIGKKTIRNDNVYLDPESSFASMRLKKYEELLAKQLESLEETIENPI